MEKIMYINPVIEAQLEARILDRNTVQPGPWLYNTYDRCLEEVDQPWDGGKKGFISWRDNGIQCPQEWVKRVEADSYLQEAVSHLVDPILNKYVKDEIIVAPGIHVGKLLSFTESVRQSVANYLSSKDAKNLNTFMRSKGYTIETDIEFFGYGMMHESAIAGIHRTEKSLKFNKGFMKRIATEVAKYNKDREWVDISELIENTVEHELVHLYGVRSEEELEALLVEFYETHGDRDNPKYAHKKAVSEDRLANVAKNYPGQYKILEVKYREEAKEIGLDKNETEDYVASRLKDSESEEKVYENRETKEPETSEKGEKDFEENKESGETQDSEESQEAAENGGDAE